MNGVVTDDWWGHIVAVVEIMGSKIKNKYLWDGGVAFESSLMIKN